MSSHVDPAPADATAPPPGEPVGSIESLPIDVPVTQTEGQRWPQHVHDDHELLHAHTGRVTVRTPHAHYAVPRGASIWLPAGVPHDVHAAAGSSLRCSWFGADLAPAGLGTVTVLVTPPLFDRVLEHVMARDLTPAERRRAEAFALDLLRPATALDVELVRPRRPWLVVVTDALALDPADDRTLADWAQLCSVSPRTFARRFAEETGTSFARWRTELRLATAVQRLSTGEPVAAVARTVGFGSQAAFTTAFRRGLGVTTGAVARGARP